VAARVTGKSIAAAGLADGESRDRGAELRTAGSDGLLARLKGYVFDDWGRAGHGRGGGQERAEESGGDGELHFGFFGDSLRSVIVCVVSELDGMSREEGP